MEISRKKVVIVGGGLSGLAAAALLAKEGHSVTVLEKNSTIGGRARVFQEKGFTFDMGPSWYLMPDVFERFFAMFGKKPQDFMDLRRLDPQYAIFFGAKERLTISKNIQENLNLFESLESGSKKKLEEYFSISRQIYDFAANNKNGFVYKYFGSLLDFLDIHLIQLLFKINFFQSFASFVKKFTKSDKIFRTLGYPTVFLGGSPDNLPSIYTMMSHVDFDLGGWYPMGGIGELPKALEQIGSSYGVKYITNAEVKSVELENGRRIKSVNTQKGSFDADVFLATTDLHHFETQLLSKDKQTFGEDFFKRQVMAPATLLIYLGVKGRIKNLEHHNLVLKDTWEDHFKEIFDNPAWPQKPSYYICAPSKTDPSVAPPDSENLFILIPVSSGLEDSGQKAEGLAAWAISDLEKMTGDAIADRIIYKKIYSHKDMTADYHAYAGTAFAQAQTLWQTAYFRPHNKSKKLSNLYYAGHYTQPGIGMPMVLISAEFAADRIKSDFLKNK